VNRPPGPAAITHYGKVIDMTDTSNEKPRTPDQSPAVDDDEKKSAADGSPARPDRDGAGNTSPETQDDTVKAVLSPKEFLKTVIASEGEIRDAVSMTEADARKDPPTREDENDTS
jgi:hypothetical protein